MIAVADNVQFMKCSLVQQGYEMGSCLVKSGHRLLPACRSTYREDGHLRLIKAIHLSRPEHYLSIYQSGCNFYCLKCHSWYFSKQANGIWMSPEDIGKAAERYVEEYSIVYEPRERATSYHALDLCRGCGSCIMLGRRSRLCPNAISIDKIELSEQGWGPARNIVAFTGGDIACKPEFYARTAEEIKKAGKLWVLFETNGYGLTPENLDVLEGKVDAFWLDIKAYDEKMHRKLTGASNKRILQLPEEIVDRGFVLEVLSLYIPGWVETDQIRKIAELLANADPSIPFTILAFFPEYRMKQVRPPTLAEMIEAYDACRELLKNVRLGNVGIFARSDKDLEFLLENGYNF